MDAEQIKSAAEGLVSLIDKQASLEIVEAQAGLIWDRVQILKSETKGSMAPEVPPER